MKPPVTLVLYHAQCRDGWCAAWVASQRYPNAELRPVQYGTPPPAVDAMPKGTVLLVDFSYPRDAMKGLALVKYVRVLDHHKTAQAALEGLDEELRYMSADIDVTFDMERSGAGIAWDELITKLDAGSYCLACGAGLDLDGHGHQPGCPHLRPWIVSYVEDRDLWRWALPNSREVNAYISTLPYGRPEHLAAWTEASKLPLADAVTAGKVALQAIKRYAEAVCENAVTRSIVIEPDQRGRVTFKVPSVNAPQHDISEVLEHLMDLNPDAWFVHGWWQRADGMFAQSFRSRGDFDVSMVAKAFGGGGHKNAAGAQTGQILG